MSNDTEDLRDRFFNELTRKREDGVTDFNCLPHNVFEWIRDNAQQSPVTDEELILKSSELHASITIKIETNYQTGKNHLFYTDGVRDIIAKSLRNFLTPTT